MTVLEKSQKVMACLVPLTIVIISNVFGSVGGKQVWVLIKKLRKKKKKKEATKAFFKKINQWRKLGDKIIPMKLPTRTYFLEEVWADYW